jgi:hypothetical protein
MMNSSVELTRKSNNDIIIGACGVQTGDWKSVEQFHRICLNYISCSTSQIPVIRRAAGQGVLNEQPEEVVEVPAEVPEEAAAHETETDYTQEDD